MGSADNGINLRNVVLNMLEETLDRGTFSHIVVNETFAANDFTPRERAFISRLYLGCLERLIWLDYTIDAYASLPVRKMKPVVRNILRMSLYQMKYMDSVPDHAAISEAGKLMQKRGYGQLKGFVNGILRSIQRNDKEIDYPDNVLYSCPEWLYDMLTETYGDEAAKEYLSRSVSENAGVCARLNLNKGTADEIIADLEEEGCSVTATQGFPGAVRITGFESITGLKAFKEGKIFIQDINSMKVSLRAFEACDNRNPFIIDVCAAPGGKSLYLAELFPEGSVVSCDISDKKTALIDQNIGRMGYKNMRTQVWDAREYNGRWKDSADIVIADLPCSGLGVIGRKPDIKYRVTPEDLASLENLQLEILENVSKYVKKGGILVYSTCTVNRKENEENARKIKGFEMLSSEQMLGKDGADGFYISVLRKN